MGAQLFDLSSLVPSGCARGSSEYRRSDFDAAITRSGSSEENGWRQTVRVEGAGERGGPPRAGSGVSEAVPQEHSKLVRIVTL